MQDTAETIADGGIDFSLLIFMSLTVLLILAMVYLIWKFYRKSPAERSRSSGGTRGRNPEEISRPPKPAVADAGAYRRTPGPAEAPAVALKPAAPVPEPVTPEPAAARPAEPPLAALEVAEPPPAPPVVATAPLVAAAAPVVAAVPPVAVAPLPAGPAEPAWGPHVPGDSVLRRHFFAEVHRLLESVAGPVPSDSVLRRHHEQWLAAECESAGVDPSRYQKLEAEYDALRAMRAAPAPIPVESPQPDPAVAKAPAASLAEAAAVAVAAMTAAEPEVPPLVTEAAAPPAAAGAPTPAWIPEDSVLRRHFLAQVQLMLETVSGPRPTDSVLRRHHAQWLCSQMGECLADQGRMEFLQAGYEACCNGARGPA